LSESAPPETEEELRAANNTLVRRIQSMLPLVTRDEDFAHFRTLSAQFREGQISAELYYDRISAMGLASIVPDLAGLLPDAVKRQELLLAASADWNGGPRYGRGPAAAAVVAAQPSRGVRVLTPAWTCGACTLDNKPGTDFCEACGGRRRPSDAESASALAVALEAAMRTGGPKNNKGKGRVASLAAPVPGEDAPNTPPLPGPASAALRPSGPAPAPVPEFPALPGSSKPARKPSVKKRSVGVQPGNQWTQGRPL
jgi:hypothetical protein